MGKQDLVQSVAEKTGLTKADSARALDALIESIQEGLKKESKVTIVGFGTWEAKKRDSRVGHNPQTGAPVTIPARIAVSFKAGSKLKDYLNDEKAA